MILLKVKPNYMALEYHFTEKAAVRCELPLLYISFQFCCLNLSVLEFSR